MIRAILYKAKNTFSQLKEFDLPYLQGGLQFNLFYNNIGSEEFIQKMYPYDVEKIFTEQYRDYLVALSENNEDYLRNNVNQKLLDLNNKTEEKCKFELVNKDAPVKLAFQKCFLIEGIGLNRDDHGLEMAVKKVPNKSKDFLDFYQGISTNENDEGTNLILFGTKVFFKSSMKLLKIEEKEKDKKGSNYEASLNREEIHMIQFEVETRQSAFQRFLRRFVSKALNIRDQNKHKEHMMRSMIGGFGEPHWCIGDVDLILDGNLPKTVNLEMDKLTNKSKRNN